MNTVRKDNDKQPPEAVSLGELVRQAREGRGWSLSRLAERVGVHRASINRIESGEFVQPAIDIVQRLAVALELDEADLLALAGYRIPERLPTLPAYLRAKYRMPEEATRQLTSYFAFLTERYGIEQAEPRHRGARDDKSRAA